MSEIIHHFNGGLYTKEMRVTAGSLVMKHVHQHDHQSILASGEALVCIDGVAHKYTGPVVLNIRANVEHEVLAVTDMVWLCQHVTDCVDPTEVDEVLIKEA
jgi:quercetin dioxygenase-like cupin family protein